MEQVKQAIGGIEKQVKKNAGKLCLLIFIHMFFQKEFL